MSLATYIVGIVAAALVLTVVLVLLGRRRLRERHAVWWLVAGALALIAAIFPQTLEWLSALLGIGLPVNLVFFVGIAILFLVDLQMSSELTRLDDRTRSLAERVAILQLEVDRLREASNGPGEQHGEVQYETDRGPREHREP